ncbi:hypothetical protein Daesc_005633 [Daldinia eschscholtzii]|uniref:Uncharacterized protein n=1 Tax=Daldinia eschscholtzii TaxID=292717 RepID=A0AAX6MKZ1_9PEZI
MSPSNDQENQAQLCQVRTSMEHQRTQPWKRFIKLKDDRSIEAQDGEVRLQLERDQHKTLGGPLCGTNTTSQQARLNQMEAR